MVKHGKNTRLSHAGRNPDWTSGIVSTPVYRASTCLFNTYEDLQQGIKDPWARTLFYGRKGTPSQWSLEDAITDLHEGALTHLFPAGVAAVSHALLSVLGPGDHLIVTDSAYEPTRSLAEGLLKRLGVETSYIEPHVAKDIDQYFKPNTKAILLESPGSLTLEMQDIPTICAVAKNHKNTPFVLVDNTWPSPLYCQPLKLGADMAIEALTKYVGGHSDVMMGSVTANERAAGLLRRMAGQMGQTVSPDDANLVLRGLRTLAVRLKAQGESALRIAHWLQDHPGVDRVLFPALKDDPGHALWLRDMSGASGLFSFILKGGDYPDTAAMVDHMDLFKMGFSWGGFESLILPTNPTAVRTVKPWQAAGPVIRLSIGLEDTDDLIADLAAGLTRYHERLSGVG